MKSSIIIVESIELSSGCEMPIRPVDACVSSAKTASEDEMR